MKLPLRGNKIVSQSYFRDISLKREILRNIHGEREARRYVNGDLVANRALISSIYKTLTDVVTFAVTMVIKRNHVKYCNEV